MPLSLALRGVLAGAGEGRPTGLLPPLPGCTFADTSSPQVINASQDSPERFLLSRLDPQGAQGSLELSKGGHCLPLLFSLQEGRASQNPPPASRQVPEPQQPPHPGKGRTGWGERLCLAKMRGEEVASSAPKRPLLVLLLPSARIGL